jgi:hypothetical protein
MLLQIHLYMLCLDSSKVTSNKKNPHQYLLYIDVFLFFEAKSIGSKLDYHGQMTWQISNVMFLVMLVKVM